MSMPRCAGGGAGVHDRDAARQNRPQHAGGRARGQHVDAAALGQRAVVADAERLDARRAHLRRERAQLIGQPNPRLQPLQLVGVDRRKVHGVAHDAVAQEVADRGGRVDADELLRFLGRRRDVRRRDHLRQLGERPIGRRLLLEDVERRRRRRCRCSIARRSAASSISSPRAVLIEPNARLAAREARVVEQVPAFPASTAGAASGSRRSRTTSSSDSSSTPRPGAISSEMYGSCATMRMPNARARCATSWPMRPKPGDAERLAAQLGAEKPSSSPTCRPSSRDRRPGPSAPAPASARRRARRR